MSDQTSGTATAKWAVWTPRLVVSLGSQRPKSRWPEAAAVVVVAGIAMAVMGMVPFNLHEPAHFLGIMSPTCGVTRSVVAVLRGNFGTAWRYNPLGLVVAAAAPAGAVVLVAGLFTRRWVVVRVRLGRIGFVLLVAVLVVLEIRQQRRAALLTYTDFR